MTGTTTPWRCTLSTSFADGRGPTVWSISATGTSRLMISGISLPYVRLLFSMPPHPLLPIHLLYHARHLPFRDSELDRTQGNAPEGDTDIIGYRIRPIRSWRRRGSMDKSDRFAGFGLPRGFFYRQVFRRFSGLDRDEHPSIGSYVLTLFTHDGRRDNTRIPMNAGGYRSEGHRDRSMIPGTRIVGRLIGGRRVGSLDNMNVRRLDLLNGVSPGRAAFL